MSDPGGAPPIQFEGSGADATGASVSDVNASAAALADETPIAAQQGHKAGPSNIDSQGTPRIGASSPGGGGSETHYSGPYGGTHGETSGRYVNEDESPLKSAEAAAQVASEGAGGGSDVPLPEASPAIPTMEGSDGGDELGDDFFEPDVIEVEEISDGECAGTFQDPHCDHCRGGHRTSSPHDLMLCCLLPSPQTRWWGLCRTSSSVDPPWSQRRKSSTSRR